MSDAQKHWEQIYTTKQPSSVSWYQPHLERSLELIDRAGIGPDDRLIDVGGGASTLVDDLLDRGFRHVAVLDLSQRALEVSKGRLGERASRVEWIAGDVLTAELPRAQYMLWHDRAVFHFLTQEEDRLHYLRQMRHALRPGGYALVSTFAPGGPQKCSGLEVCRYSSETLLSKLGRDFSLAASANENHRTPAGAIQAFQYALLSYSG
ncbi:MAG TPA: class I SAM-dependent methyltransferase [Bacteroidota bacterium]|nr:class I SAM-dependent methyltransferase [Bacteroidota bacterium]